MKLLPLCFLTLFAALFVTAEKEEQKPLLRRRDLSGHVIPLWGEQYDGRGKIETVTAISQGGEADPRGWYKYGSKGSKSSKGEFLCVFLCLSLFRLCGYLAGSRRSVLA